MLRPKFTSPGINTLQCASIIPHYMELAEIPNKNAERRKKGSEQYEKCATNPAAVATHCRALYRSAKEGNNSRPKESGSRDGGMAARATPFGRRRKSSEGPIRVQQIAAMSCAQRSSVCIEQTQSSRSGAEVGSSRNVIGYPAHTGPTARYPQRTWPIWERLLAGPKGPPR